MKSVIAFLFVFVSASAFATDTDFCSPMAGQAAQAVADVNGTVSQTILSADSSDGVTYKVVLSEPGLGEDTYTVVTSGGHDCVVLSVKLEGEPTPRP